METPEQKTERVANSLWIGLGGPPDYFRERHGSIRKSYLMGAEAIIAEADRDDIPIDDSFDDKIGRAASAVVSAWGGDDADQDFYYRAVKAALEEEARDIEPSTEEVI